MSISALIRGENCLWLAMRELWVEMRVGRGSRLLRERCTRASALRYFWSNYISEVSPWVLLKTSYRNRFLKFSSFSSRLALYWWMFWLIISMDLFLIISSSLRCNFFTRSTTVVPRSLPFSPPCLWTSLLDMRSSSLSTRYSSCSSSVGTWRCTE